MVPGRLRWARDVHGYSAYSIALAGGEEVRTCMIYLQFHQVSVNHDFSSAAGGGEEKLVTFKFIDVTPPQHGLEPP